MQYLLLIYTPERAWTAMSEAERTAMYGEYFAFTASIKQSGHWLGGSPLQPVQTATTVRVRDGKPSNTDGPFAETREQLGGYYLIEATDAGEATAIAARIPGARLGAIEVRPLWNVNT